MSFASDHINILLYYSIDNVSVFSVQARAHGKAGKWVAHGWHQYNKYLDLYRMASKKEAMMLEDVRFKIDNIFRKYDANMSDKLEEHQVEKMMADALREMGYKDLQVMDRVRLFISRVDKDGDNKISKAELFEALCPSKTK